MRGARALQCGLGWAGLGWAADAGPLGPGTGGFGLKRINGTEVERTKDRCGAGEGPCWVLAVDGPGSGLSEFSVLRVQKKKKCVRVRIAFRRENGRW